MTGMWRPRIAPIASGGPLRFRRQDFTPRGLEGERISPGRHYFNLGGTILAVYDPEADGDPAGEWTHHPNQYIYIGVDDVDAAFRRAATLGATLESDSVDSMPWGERLFYARDPSGNPICLVDAKTLFLGNS